MTREQAAKLLPVLIAFAKGEPIQFLENKPGCVWKSLGDAAAWIFDYEYRVKPKEYWVNIFRTNANCNPWPGTIVYNTEEDAISAACSNSKYVRSINIGE